LNQDTLNDISIFTAEVHDNLAIEIIDPTHVHLGIAFHLDEGVGSEILAEDILRPRGLVVEEKRRETIAAVQVVVVTDPL